jgi:hypothetical protein
MDNLYKLGARVLKKEGLDASWSFYEDCLQEAVIAAWKVDEADEQAEMKRWVKMRDVARKFKRADARRKRKEFSEGLTVPPSTDTPRYITKNRQIADHQKYVSDTSALRQEDRSLDAVHAKQVLAKLLTAEWLTEKQYEVLVVLMQTEGDRKEAAKLLKTDIKHITNTIDYIKKKANEEGWLE